ncbi:MAG TPA: transketolase C-terminal domain-containing protein [Solirubrobacterales bacterium]|jgi:pyruvate/2-oxoglutarate/acetoin dehydrogenase E1 component|nr:transketolase C-terminal domain-containing protein [Solirubrobacterales bacterium]
MHETVVTEAAPAAATITFREAINEALRLEMEEDPGLLLMGEVIATAEGASRVTGGLVEEFGPGRVIETPVSENMLVGAGLGGALGGQRMVIEVMSADFLLTAASEILNDMAKWRYQHRWEGPLSLVLRMPMGSGVPFAGPEHQQCIEGYLHRAAGLTVVNPGSAATVGGLLRAAIRLGDPVVFLEHRRLYATTVARDEAELEPDETPIGRATAVREGDDLTIVAWSWMRAIAETAADSLAAEGIAAEIVDPVTIKPLDSEAILASVAKTGHLLVVEEAPRTGCVGAHLLSLALEAGHGGPGQMGLVTMPDVPHPFSGVLGGVPIPTAEQVRERAVEMLRA